MIAGAGSLQKLLHLANAREAFASGDFPQALSEVDAAVAADATFAAAKSLRQEIVARMNAVPPTVAKSPLVREHIMIPARPQPHRRTHALWPARVRTGVAICTLFGVGLVSVMLVRSGRRGTNVPAPAAVKIPSAVPAGTVKTPAAAVPVAVDVELPPSVRTAPAPLPKATPANAPDIGATEWASARLTQLNVRPRWRASAMQVEDAALIRDLGEGISELWVGKLTGNEDAIFVGGSLDASDWAKLRDSIKPTGIVWRIYPRRSGPASEASVAPAVAAGFMRGRRVRYSSEYVAEQFTPRARPLLRPTRAGRTAQE